MPIMIWIAIIVEFAIQNYIDAGILLGIQFINASKQSVHSHTDYTEYADLSRRRLSCLTWIPPFAS